MTTLESRHYVATESDMEVLADNLIQGIALVDGAPLSYLRCLLATAKHDLGMPLGPRRGKPVKLTEEEHARQVAAVQAVHDRFYPVLVRRFDERIPKGRDHAKTLNARTNRFRTAMYAIRQWLAAKHDLGTINPETASKRTLEVVGPKRTRRVSPTMLRKRVERQATELVKQVLALAETDKSQAIAELDLLVGQLTQQLIELTGKPLSDPQQAAEQHRPFRQKGSSVVFMPTQTQVIRQQANPS